MFWQFWQWAQAARFNFSVARGGELVGPAVGPEKGFLVKDVFGHDGLHRRAVQGVKIGEQRRAEFGAAAANNP